LYITEDEIFGALQTLNVVDQRLRIDADINEFAEIYLKVPFGWNPLSLPAEKWFTEEAGRMIKTLNGPYADAYAAILLIKYCT
jgi:hypothetical protein